MKGFVADIEDLTEENTDFRRVLYTGHHLQLVLMALKPGEEIGLETHDDVDQFIRVEAGHGTAFLDGKEAPLEDGAVVVIPAGTKHNITNTSRTDALKLYTLYSPPEHPDGTIHKGKAEADAYERKHHR